MNIVRGKNKSAGTSRDIGLNHGAGKGDAMRSFSREYRENMEAIDWKPTPAHCRPGFVRTGPGRYRKVFR